MFDEEGATNAIFIFSVLAAHTVHRERELLHTLNLIPAGCIDAFGMNVYSRPLTAYGGSSPEPPTFQELTEPWMHVLDSSKHRGLPFAVPEMGISSQASDAQRARWLRDGFRFARSHRFVMLTYFNYPHRYWHLDEQTACWDAFLEQVGTGGPDVPVQVASLQPPAQQPRPAAIVPEPRPGPVQPVSPADSSVWDRVPALTWAAVPAADRYRVTLCTAAEPERPIYTVETDQLTCTLPRENLRQGTRYLWHVTALQGSRTSESDPQFSFTFDHVDPPEISQPAVQTGEAAWTGGPLRVSVVARSRNILKGARVLVEMQGAAPRTSALRVAATAAGATRWSGSCDVPPNRSGKWQEASLTFEVEDVAGNRSVSAVQTVRIAPRNPQSGPLLEIDGIDSGAPLSGVVRVQCSHDHAVRRSTVVYLLMVDGTEIARSARAPFGLSWNTAELPGGTHRLVLALRDTLSGEQAAADIEDVVVASPPSAPSAGR